MSVAHNKLNNVSLGKNQKILTSSAAYAFIFFTCYALLGGWQNPDLFSMVILLVNLVFMMARMSPSVILYSSFLLPNELVCILSVFVWIAFSPQVQRHFLEKIRIPAIFLILGSIIAISSLVNAAISSTFNNVFASLMYVAILAFFGFKFKDAIKISVLYQVNRLFIVVELLVSSLTYLRVGFIPGDQNFGTFENAHFFGLWCCLSLAFLLLMHRRYEHRIVVTVGYATAIVFMLYLADAKAIVAASLAAVLVWLICRLFIRSEKTITVALYSFLAIIISVVFLLGTPSVKETLTSSDFEGSTFVNTHIYGNVWSLKYQYFEGTFTSLATSPYGIFGYGLGQYGSRFANLFGWDSTFRSDSSLNRLVSNAFDSNMNSDYRVYASRYNQEMVSQIAWYSAVSSYPFSSLIALLAEGGVVGCIFLGLLLNRLKLGNAAQILLIMFIGCCLVDIFFDHIQLVGFVLLLITTLRGESVKPKALTKSVQVSPLLIQDSNDGHLGVRPSECTAKGSPTGLTRILREEAS